MNYIVKISDDVLADVSDILDWYNLISDKVSEKFERDMISRLEYLSDNPLHYQIRHNNKVRIAPLKGFPYGIHYFIKNDTIYVIAVFHYNLSPKHWKGRL